jgi:hypothetical protein
LARCHANSKDFNLVVVATHYSQQNLVVPLRQWTHVAVTADVSTQTHTLYYNGHLINSGKNLDGIVLDSVNGWSLGGCHPSSEENRGFTGGMFACVYIGMY